MNQIVVSSEELNAAAASVGTLKEEMSSLFEQMKSTIHQMNAFWQSPASQAAMSQFDTLSPVFGQFTGIVDNYCVFLRQTAAAYQENEAVLSGHAG